MQSPADKSGACKSWGRSEDLLMILWMLFLVLLFRTRRTKLKIDIDL